MAHHQDKANAIRDEAAEVVRTESALEALEHVSSSAPTDMLLAPIRLLRNADAAFALRLRRHLKVSGNEFAALTLIEHCEDLGDFAHVKDVSSSLGVTSAAATVIVDRLVTQGHISRTIDPSDGRSRLLRVTAETRTLLRTATQRTSDALAALAATVSPRDAARVVKLVQKTTAILETGPTT